MAWKILLALAFSAAFLFGCCNLSYNPSSGGTGAPQSFGDLKQDAQVSNSVSYWRGEARPIAMLEYAVSADGIGSFTLQNTDATGTLTINGIEIAGKAFKEAVALQPGETKRVEASGLPAGGKGGLYKFDAKITYTTPNGVQATQYGAKPIVGRYS